MDRSERNTGPGAKDRLNKRPTSEAEGRTDAEFDQAGNVGEKGQDPSPGDRDRGERSEREPAGAEQSGR
jgi:hypothetical protein